MTAKQCGLPRNTLVRVIPLAPLLGALAVPSRAQVLEEVVVVARKRVENLQDTPVAVTAFGSDSMREAQINNLADLSPELERFCQHRL